MEYALAPADAVVVPQKMEFKNNFKVFMDSLTAIVGYQACCFRQRA